MNRSNWLLATFGSLLVVAAASAAAAEPGPTCATCHAPQAALVAASAHKALRCTECHRGQEKFELSAAELKKYAPPAGGGTRPAFDHGGDFIGKPKRGQIPDLCGACHADVARMNPFGLRTDQLAAYWTSGHGKTLKTKGDDRVAVCIDCHGNHEILSSKEPRSRTYPLNVPGTCGSCHEKKDLMGEFDLPVEVVDEYRHSVHGVLLLEQKDTGAPNCATCHGNHAATPPGFASVSSVCGQCHQHAAANFATSIHATQSGHKGCVQCHGGGEGKHDHAIERITKPTGVLIQRYAHLLSSNKQPTAEQVAATVHYEPKQIIKQALTTCTECHEAIEKDESLPKLFKLLDEIASAERTYVETAHHLDQVGQGVLLVDAQRFKFEDARTHLIALAPLQHTLDNTKVAAKVAELRTTCDQVNSELNELETGLRWRFRALIPVWAFAVVFAAALYLKYKALRAAHVEPMPSSSGVK